MAEKNCICTDCGAGFISRRSPKRCKPCAAKRINANARARSYAKEGRVPRSAYLAEIRKDATGNFTCVQCGKDSYRKLSGTNKANGHANKYCSMSCRKKHLVELSPPKFSPVFRGECKVCEKVWWQKHKSVARCCSEQCEIIDRSTIDWSSLACKCCGDKLSPKVKTYQAPKYCGVCGPIIMEDALKAHRRASRAARRALLKAATVERFDPLVVLARDNWTCQLCGVPTPKAKRGTYADDAPELDHMVPLSRGGEHSTANTQCLCRKCNAEKSDMVLYE
jgi:hypothetical protein